MCNALTFARRFAQIIFAIVSSLSLLAIQTAAADTSKPIVPNDLVFAEQEGIVAVEAEHFVRQENTDVRAFHIISPQHVPEITPDGDPAHLDNASGGAYVEALPDSRRTHDDKLIVGENFSNDPGKLAVLTYRVNFENPGKYYVWVRAHSTGSEDNGLHVGIDGTWPSSGRRLQWCEGKNSWRWDSKQRTAEEHCGEPFKIFLDVPTKGVHEIQFSMREDGFEFDRWLMTKEREFTRPLDAGPDSIIFNGTQPETFASNNAAAQATGTGNIKLAKPLQLPRGEDGNGDVAIEGELKQWHNIILTLDGPFAHELDTNPNPFVNYEMNVTFTHQSGSPSHRVCGYFAADGKAAESSAQSGTKWRAHLAPEKTGEWKYEVEFVKGRTIVETDVPEVDPVLPYHGKTGTFTVADSDKSGRDLRAHGRLVYVGQRYLQFAGSGQYFLKAGADAPETLLGYADFDNTIAGKPAKVPLKKFEPHLQDWNSGDPTWQNGKGKGLLGAINYLSGKGCNAFSFLTYNAGGDGDNVWPFVQRNEKMHYDCSKLDQWGIVFNHGTHKGMYLHFKMQETENDDDRLGPKRNQKSVPESLDGGRLGPERRLYCRELIARFGHALALNWNLGEENTQSTEEQMAMINFIDRLDPYKHNIVLHTFPEQQDEVYNPLIGNNSKLTGLSLQNSGIQDTHWQVVKWVQASQRAGKPWVVAFDESGTAAHGQCPDLGYQGFDGRDKSGKRVYTEHEVRRQTLWGTLMGGGAGVEYYFGYQFVENDLNCEDWRSRDRSWDYCRIAIEFFHENNIPFVEMQPADDLVSSDPRENDRYCLAKKGELYLVYVANGQETKLDLTDETGTFSIEWFNPKLGGGLSSGSKSTAEAGKSVSLGTPPDSEDANQDWLAIVSKQ